ncbi:hypothetical protein [Nostocoides vanveenii]|jgi:hypothetical protein|uniref:Uncharacterized protein n=1 Tax=Nostocoides vanveenii TaxID=330835 RepID=A0ABN2K6P5_9MICO
MSHYLIKAHLRLTAAIRDALTDRENERGDVPGWVLITIMTAGLVAAIWAIAQDRLSAMFEDAINSVKPGGN